MKKKLLSLLLTFSMVATMLVGCGNSNDSGSADLNTEKQISTKNFNKAIEAFKEYYDTFYEEHRFNGSFENSWDCFANIYMLEGEPVMAVLDILAIDENSFYSEYEEDFITNEVATADLYLFEYSGKEVQVRAKYTSIQTSDEEIYLVPMQDKLFMGYFDKEGQFVTAELGEYCTLLDEEYYAVYHDDISEEYANKEKYIDEVCSDWISYDSLEDVDTTYAIESDTQEKIFLETGLGDSGNDGSYLLHWYHDRDIDYALQNYQLVSDAIDFEDEEDFFYGTSFKKYLDYLMEQEITNNIDLRVCHSEYLIDNTDEDADYLQVFIWMDGIYYVINEGVAYVYAFDYGYTEDDLPKDLCGYEISDKYWADVLYEDYIAEHGGNTKMEDRRDMGSYFPIFLDYKIDLEDVWKEVEVAKAEYEQSVGAALEAYEDYIDDNEDYIEREMFRYQLFCLDDNDTPELFLVNDFGYGVVYTYYNGELVSQDIGSSYFSGKERQGTIYWSDGRDYFYSDTVYKLQDGKFEKVFAGSHEHDWDTETATYHYTKNSEEVYVTKEEYDSVFNAVYDKEIESLEISYIEAFDDFDDACEEAGFDN